MSVGYFAAALCGLRFSIEIDGLCCANKQNEFGYETSGEGNDEFTRIELLGRRFADRCSGDLPATAQVAVNADPAEWAKVVATPPRRKLRSLLQQPGAGGFLERLAAGFRRPIPKSRWSFSRPPAGPALAKIDQEREGAWTAPTSRRTAHWAGTLDTPRPGMLLPMGPRAAGWPKEWTARRTSPGRALPLV